MSDEVSGQIVAGLLTSFGFLVGTLVTHFLDRQRKKEEILLNAKKDVYSKILVGMSSSFMENPSNFVEELSDKNFRSKIIMRAGELLTQGRLLSSKTLSDKLRDFFKLEQGIWDNLEKDGDMTNPNTSRATLVYEIEVLMKKELGVR